MKRGVVMSFIFQLAWGFVPKLLCRYLRKWFFWFKGILSDFALRYLDYRVITEKNVNAHLFELELQIELQIYQKKMLM